MQRAVRSEGHKEKSEYDNLVQAHKEALEKLTAAEIQVLRGLGV